MAVVVAKTWVGSGTIANPGSGNWSNGANWSPSGVPLPADTLTIGSASQANAFTLTVDTAAVATSITMNGNPASSRFTTLTLTAGNSLATERCNYLQRDGCDQRHQRRRHAECRNGDNRHRNALAGTATQAARWMYLDRSPPAWFYRLARLRPQT